MTIATETIPRILERFRDSNHRGSLEVVGAAGSGARAVWRAIAALSLAEGSSVSIIDWKRRREWGDLVEMGAEVATEPDAAITMLRGAFVSIDRRFCLLRGQPTRRWHEATGGDTGSRVLYFVADAPTAAELDAHRNDAVAMMFALIADVATQGRPVGIDVVVHNPRPGHRNFPSGLRASVTASIQLHRAAPNDISAELYEDGQQVSEISGISELLQRL